METTTIILFLLGFLQVVMLGILGWALLTIVGHGNDISTLKANVGSTQAETNRRFDELNKKLDSLTDMVGEVLMHRRNTDGRDG